MSIHGGIDIDAMRMEDVHYTVKDVMSLPRGERAELIDGDIYMMAPPDYMHQKMISYLVTAISNYISSHGGDCEVLPAPFGVYLENDESNYVEPDISVICDPSKIRSDGCHGAPDWIIEVVSPSSRRMDCFIKLNKYRSAGVREYWIIDHKTKSIRVYDFSKDSEDNYEFNTQIKACIYADLLIDMSPFG